MRAGVFVALMIAVLTCPAFGSSDPDSGAAGTDPGQQGLSPQPTVAPGAYRISPGDILSITVWNEDRLTRDCQVNGAGTISYPLLGDVPAAGATCSELETRLSESLQKYMKHPQVIVTVREYGALGMSVFVLGEVKTPGVYPLASGYGLMQAVAAAGGPTSLASGEITILKAWTGEFHTTGLEQAMAGTLPVPEAAVEAGDVIVLGRKVDADQDRRYAVLGEVPEPGMFDMPAEGEVRVLDAMQEAGLLSTSPGSGMGGSGTPIEEQFPTADLEHALLTRDDIVVPLNLAALLQGDTSQNLLLQSGDILTVPRRSLVTVYVVGEVRMPGRQLLPINSSVLDLLNTVGGVTSAANLSDAKILRLVNGKPAPIPVDLGRLLHRGDAEQNITLQEGDVLFVPARGERRDILRYLYLIPYLLR